MELRTLSNARKNSNNPISSSSNNNQISSNQGSGPESLQTPASASSVSGGPSRSSRAGRAAVESNLGHIRSSPSNRLHLLNPSSLIAEASNNAGPFVNDSNPLLPGSAIPSAKALVGHELDSVSSSNQSDFFFGCTRNGFCNS